MEIAPYIDFHTHKRVEMHNAEVVEIISMHKDVKNREGWFTLGFHPWWLHETLSDDDLQNMKSSLASDELCLALGECGLDGLKGASTQIQEKNFELQLALADEMKAPVIIHCVRRYDRLLQIRKNWLHQSWVVHGYRRNKILTQQMLDENIKVSVSPFEGANESFVETLQYLPDTAFFLETDSDHRLGIVARYQLMANLRKIDIFALREQMYQNCCNFFQWKQWPQPGLSERLY